MTPEQKLKHMILIHQSDWDKTELPEITAANIDQLYDEAGEDGELQDARNEIRCSGIETDLSTPHSRHYEGDAVAAKAPDGTWVGWTYWHGGGKYGEPEAIDWMCDAYDLECKEEEKLVIVHTFTKPA